MYKLIYYLLQKIASNCFVSTIVGRRTAGPDQQRVAVHCGDAHVFVHRNSQILYTENWADNEIGDFKTTQKSTSNIF